MVGAHLTGMPLNWQLTDIGAQKLRETRTAPEYRLYALPGTTPPKPGLIRVAEGGAALAVEVWNVPRQHVGTFLAQIPAPLGLGSLKLEDGGVTHGFICEGVAVEGAQDVTSFGGWRAYVASQNKK